LSIALHCWSKAIAQGEALQALADTERRNGAPYLRPIVLIQSEPRRTGIETLDAARVREALVTHHRVPPKEIAVATGEERGLDPIETDYARWASPTPGVPSSSSSPRRPWPKAGTAPPLTSWSAWLRFIRPPRSNNCWDGCCGNRMPAAGRTRP
jgi:hypothetical protein